MAYMNKESQKKEALRTAATLFKRAAALGRIINKHILFWLLFGGIPGAGICIYIKAATEINLPWFIFVTILIMGASGILLISFLTVHDVIDLPNKIKTSKDSLMKSPEERQLLTDKQDFEETEEYPEKKGLMSSLRDLRTLFKFDFKTLFALLDLSGGVGSLTAMLSPLFYIMLFIAMALNFLTGIAGVIVLIVAL